MRQGLLLGSLLLSVLSMAACDGGDATTGTGGSAGQGGTTTSTVLFGGGAAGGNGGSGGSGGDTSSGAGGAGGAGNTANTGGSGGSTTDDLAALSDDFDDPSTLPQWTLLHEELGTPVPYDSLDIDTTAPGKLVVVPTVSAWFEDLMATFLYKEVTGDFVVEVDAAAYQKGTAQGAPTQQYNSAGLLIRDPSSVTGSQDWLMYNIGYQDSGLGFEGKATTGSQSELHFADTEGQHAARLRMCRLGNTVRMLRRLPGEPTWTETHVFPGSFPATPAFTLPATVQVGIIDNAYLVAGVRAEFEYIHFARVTDPADCTAD